MINPELMIGGVAVGIAADQASKFVNHVRGEEVIPDPDFYTLAVEQRDFLRLIAERLSTQLTPALNENVRIQPYPLEYRVPQYDRAHLCMFVPSGISGSAGAYTPTTATIKIYLEIPGIGSHTKTINSGWNQLDLPVDTLIATADGNTYPVVISFRDDAIGVAL